MSASAMQGGHSKIYCRQHLFSTFLQSGIVCSRTLLMQPSTSGENNWQRACVQMDNILNIYC